MDQTLSMEQQVSNMSFMLLKHQEHQPNKTIFDGGDNQTISYCVHHVQARLQNALLYKINQQYLNKLQRIQNVCSRLVMKSRACDSSEDLRKALPWLPIEQRIVFKVNLLTYKCLDNEAPKYLQNLLTMSSSANPPVLRAHADCRRD